MQEQFATGDDPNTQPATEETESMTMNGEISTAERTSGEATTDRIQAIVQKRDIYQDVEALKQSLAVQAVAHTGALATQAAVQAGALATATAASAGANATLAATQAGAIATQTALQAGQMAATSAAIMGLWSTLVGSLASLVAGIVLGAYFLRNK